MKRNTSLFHDQPKHDRHPRIPYILFLQTYINPASFPGSRITGIISESVRGFGYRSVKD
jgi:hypothetical protein